MLLTWKINKFYKSWTNEKYIRSIIANITLVLSDIVAMVITLYYIFKNQLKANMAVYVVIDMSAFQFLFSNWSKWFQGITKFWYIYIVIIICVVDRQYGKESSSVFLILSFINSDNIFVKPI